MPSRVFKGVVKKALGVDIGEPLILLDGLECSLKSIKTPDVIVLNGVFFLKCTRVRLYFSLFFLQGGLEGLIGENEIIVSLDAVLVAHFFIVLSVVIHASAPVNPHISFQNIFKEPGFWFCDECPNLQAREEHNILPGGLIKDNTFVASISLVESEHDHFRLRR